MKTFINKLTTMAEGDKTFSYADLSVLCLNKVPQSGFTPEEMLSRLTILKKLKEVDVEATVELEDAEAEKLKTVVQDMSWGALHEDLLAFVEYTRDCLK